MSEQQQTLTIQQAIDLGVQHHKAGRLPQAESIYQQILQADPNQPVALHLLGVIAHQTGKNDIAVDLITKALAIKPDLAEAHSNLGLALQDLGKSEDAIASYRKALALKPDYAEAHYNLGNALKDLGKLEDAVVSYDKAIEIKPDYAEAHNNLGFIFHELRRLEEAEKCFRSALEFKPDTTKAMVNLGNVLKDNAYNRERTGQLKPAGLKGDKTHVDHLVIDGLWDEALVRADQALTHKPRNTDALALKSAVLLGQNKQEEWEALCDFDRLIQTQTMGSPQGYADIRSFNEALLQRCACDANRVSESFGKSIRMGQRINFLQRDPLLSPVQPLLDFANTAATHYRSNHPTDPQHPFLAQSPKQWEITAWGSILGEHGYHESHMHGSGWLSGVYYGKIPKIMETDNEKREGWIEFGRPKNYVANRTSPEFRYIRPHEGMMILFPSYLYHRTIPLETDDVRFTVAFDIIPVLRY